MGFNYKRLFSISLLHDFYLDGQLPDVAIRPTAETAARLRGLNLVFKSEGAGNHVLFKASDDAGTPVYAVDEAVDFVFTLHVRFHSEFQNITNLNQGNPSRNFAAGKVPFFENNPANASNDVENPEEIAHTLIDRIRGRIFTYTYTLDPAPTPEETILRVKGPDGQEETITYNESNEFSPNAEGVYHVPVDLSGKASGKYTFTVRNKADDADLNVETIYVDNKLAGSSLQGIIRISYDPDSGHLYGDTEYYGIKFVRREAKWVYYIANKNGSFDLSTSDLTIEDKSGDDGSHTYSTYSFGKGGEPDPEIAINGYDTVVFTSVESIPFYQKPKLHLNLKVDDDVIIENLPNPPVAGVSGEFAEIFVFV